MPLGALGCDQEMPGALEFIIERLMPDDLELLRVHQAPTGAVTPDDCGRADVHMRHAGHRVAKVTHGSCLHIDPLIRLRALLTWLALLRARTSLTVTVVRDSVNGPKPQQTRDPTRSMPTIAQDRAKSAKASKTCRQSIEYNPRHRDAGVANEIARVIVSDLRRTNSPLGIRQPKATRHAGGRT